MLVEVALDLLIQHGVAQPHLDVLRSVLQDLVADDLSLTEFEEALEAKLAAA